MERIASDEERIKRAEEIYYRRKEQGIRVAGSSVNVRPGKRISLGKKMTIRILICMCIYVCIQIFDSSNNAFSKNLVSQIKSVLNYDTNFGQLYNQFMEYCVSSFNNVDVSNKDNSVSENEVHNNVLNENGSNENNLENNENSSVEDENMSEDEMVDNIEENTVGGEDNQIEVENKEDSANIVENNTVSNDGTQKAKLDSENVTQMEEDAEYIKQNYNLIKPIEGKITSGFGEREETEIISAFHQGVDIAGSTGTPIYASMEGTVVAASFAGEYGNHIKIQNGEVLTVYAHCSQLEVKVGDYINQKQEIGKVGATGKVTGPHLHFEIRRDGRYVNPELILNF